MGKNRDAYYANGATADDNEWIGYADSSEGALYLARTVFGRPASEATDTCDANGSTTDDDEARVWIVLQ